MCFTKEITGAMMALNLGTGLFLTKRGHWLSRTQVKLICRGGGSRATRGRTRQRARRIRSRLPPGWPLDTPNRNQPPAPAPPPAPSCSTPSS